MATVDVGVVGAGNRADSLVESLPEAAAVAAVCDVDADRADAKQSEYGARGAYTDYEAMLDAGGIDAVVLATPQQLHAPQASLALERDIHVFSEVPPAVGEEQARRLVRTAEGSRGEYTLGENAIYFRENRIVSGLVDAGLFGERYFGRGEYVHDLKHLPECTPWRREWQLGVNGVSYPTHQLGPLLEWFEGDRVERVACRGSGHHYTDASGRAYELEDTVLMLCQTEQGSLLEIRQDMVSNRPHQPRAIRHALQGTRGCYEKAAAETDVDRVWLADYHETAKAHERRFHRLEEFEAEFLSPDQPSTPVADFTESLRRGESTPLGVHAALDMTLPGLASREAIDGDSAWVPVPDSREW